MDTFTKSFWIILSVIFLVFFIGIFIGLPFTIVPAGHVGVQSLYGNVYEQELNSGFHFKNPLVGIIDMSIQTQEYTMSNQKGEGARMNDDSIKVLTKEGLAVKLDTTVFYSLKPDKASNVYEKLGVSYPEKIIRPEIRGSIRDIAAQYTAKTIYSKNRSQLTKKIESQLKKAFKKRGVVLEKVVIRDVTLPQKLSDSIEAKLSAEQEAKKMEFVLQKEEKEAERKEVEAQGIRNAQKIISKSLTDQYLKYYAIEMMKKLTKSKNTTFLFVPTGADGATPMTNIPLNKMDNITNQ